MRSTVLLLVLAFGALVAVADALHATEPHLPMWHGNGQACKNCH
jgi:hypothetical protein